MCVEEGEVSHDISLTIILPGTLWGFLFISSLITMWDRGDC